MKTLIGLSLLFLIIFIPPLLFVVGILTIADYLRQKTNLKEAFKRRFNEVFKPLKILIILTIIGTAIGAIISLYMDLGSAYESYKKFVMTTVADYSPWLALLLAAAPLAIIVIIIYTLIIQSRRYNARNRN